MQMNGVMIPPSKRVYFLGNSPCPARLGGALFARKESTCVQAQNNTKEPVDVRFYDVTTNGSTYIYKSSKGGRTLNAKAADFVERPGFQGVLKGVDREIVVSFPSGNFMRRTISGGFSGLREAPNTFSIGPDKIDATRTNFDSNPDAILGCPSLAAAPAKKGGFPMVTHPYYYLPRRFHNF
jgi:hypothetical protein